MGWSDPATASPTAAQSANDLWALLGRAKVAPPYLLIAASAGSLDAEMLARDHPEAIRALVFLDALDGSAVDALLKPLAELRREACVASWLARVGLLRLINPLKLHGRTATRLVGSCGRSPKAVRSWRWLRRFERTCPSSFSVTASPATSFPQDMRRRPSPLSPPGIACKRLSRGGQLTASTESSPAAGT
jgi:pimeloyl-ACP methyl ester carboxylesterase